MLLIEFPLEKTFPGVSKVTDYATPTNALQIDFSVSTRVDRPPRRRFPRSGLNLATKAQEKGFCGGSQSTNTSSGAIVYSGE